MTLTSDLPVKSQGHSSHLEVLSVVGVNIRAKNESFVFHSFREKYDVMKNLPLAGLTDTHHYIESIKLFCSFDLKIEFFNILNIYLESKTKFLLHFELKLLTNRYFGDMWQPSWRPSWIIKIPS